jgi:hypothetical protein
MTNEDLDKAKQDAESWLTRSDEDKAYKGTAMPEAQARAMAATLLEFMVLVPLLDELFFNTDGDEAFTKFMTAEKAYQKFRGRDEDE